MHTRERTTYHRRMCFSAEASFVGAAVVGGVGVATLSQVRHKRELVYAALPMGFAAHQLLEGMTWVDLSRRQCAMLSGWTVHLWVIYAWALLPAWVPLGVWLLEPSDARRNRILPFVVLGFAMMVYMLTLALHPSIEVRVVASNLDYELPFSRPWLLAIPYILCTCVSGLLSSYRWVRVFAVGNVVALTIATIIKAADFSSIWCTLAAFISVLIFWHFYHRRREVAHIAA